jgi:predicted  nucleic acid-binding Zn-ribbon protein
MIADIWNSLESFYSLEPVSKEFQPYILNLKPIVGFISKPEQQGEKKMSNITDSVTRKVYNIDLSILAALVGSEQDDLATLLGSDHVTGSNPELKAALEEMAAEEKRAKIKAAAQEIRKVLEATTAVKTSLVEAIRSARREEAKALDRIRKIEQATAYASETMDYRPMVALLLGQDSIELPKEWLDKQTAGVKSGGKSNRPAGKK